jgi:hypothetical protein
MPESVTFLILHVANLVGGGEGLFDTAWEMTEIFSYWERGGGGSRNMLHADLGCVPVHILKCTLVQALRLCASRMAHRGRRGIALLFNNQRH